MPCYVNFEQRRKVAPFDAHDGLEQVFPRRAVTPTSSWVLLQTNTTTQHFTARINTDDTPAQFYVGLVAPVDDTKAYVVSGYQRVTLGLQPGASIYVKAGGTVGASSSSGGGVSGEPSSNGNEVTVVVPGLEPPSGIAPLTPGTPITPGRWLIIACTTPGIVRTVFANNSIFDYPVQVGVSEIFGAFKDVDPANTTAVASYAIKYGSESGNSVGAISVSIAGIETPSGIVTLTPGTPVTPGRWLVVVCTVAGVVRAVFNNDTYFDFPVEVGVSEIYGSFKNVNPSGTTAVATYGIKQ